MQAAFPGAGYRVRQWAQGASLEPQRARPSLADCLTPMRELANTPEDLPSQRFDLIGFCDACSRLVRIGRTKVPPGLTTPELSAWLRCTDW